MAESGFTLVQSRFGGPFDSALAETLLPFLAATMDHGKRSLRTKAQQMWHATFANSLKTAEIPKDVAEMLRKSLLLSSESSSQAGSCSTSNIREKILNIWWHKHTCSCTTDSASHPLSHKVLLFCSGFAVVTVLTGHAVPKL